MYFIFDKIKNKKIKKYFFKKKAEKNCDKLNNKYNELNYDSLYIIRYEVIYGKG